MSSSQDASMDAGQTISSEAKAAVAADNLENSRTLILMRNMIRIPHSRITTKKIPYQLSKRALTAKKP